MTDNRVTAICERMIALMHTNSLAVDAYTVGIFPAIPTAARFALCQLVILNGVYARVETGSRDGAYEGQAIFDVMGQDLYRPTGNPPVARAASYLRTVDLCQAFCDLFTRDDLVALGGLDFAQGGHVERIELDLDVEYLIGIERDNAAINRGTINFRVITKEPVT